MRRKHIKVDWLDRNLSWLFPLPAGIAVLVLVVGPIVANLIFSLENRSFGAFPPPSLVGLANYSSAMHDPRFWNSVKNTFYLTALSVPIETIFGLVIALLINRSFALKGLVRTLILLPMIATPVAIALIWSLMMNPQLGVLNYFLQVLHLPRLLWASSPTFAIPSLALVDIWEWSPFMALIILAALQSMPSEILEAASIDGVTPWQLLSRIIIPLIRPALITAIVLRTIDALKTFDIIYVITQGGPGIASETLNVYAFKSSFLYLRVGYASSLLVLLAILVIGIAILLNVWLKRAQT